jgi:hypothetical protein
MPNRIETLRRHIVGVLLSMPDPFERRCAYVHLYGVAQFSTLIAMKRNENPELATMAGMLHDFYAFKFGDPENHGPKGALFVWEVLNELCLTSSEETDMICAAIHNHSDKGGHFDAFTEILIDADVMQHCLYDITMPVADREKERYQALLDEFGLNREES